MLERTRLKVRDDGGQSGPNLALSSLRGRARELKTAGLALLGAFGVFSYSIDAAVLPAVAALLGVSAMGWHRILRRRPELELIETSPRDLSERYGWGSVVQAIPPLVFLGSTYMHSRLHFGFVEGIFIVAGFVTAVPAVGFAMRSLTIHRLAGARGHDGLGDSDSAGPLTAPPAE